MKLVLPEMTQQNDSATYDPTLIKAIARRPFCERAH
jgi:hypothetical protein